MAPIVINEDGSGSGGSSQAGCKWKKSNGWRAGAVDEDDMTRGFRSRGIWVRWLDEVVGCSAPI